MSNSSGIIRVIDGHLCNHLTRSENSVINLQFSGDCSLLGRSITLYWLITPIAPEPYYDLRVSDHSIECFYRVKSIALTFSTICTIHKWLIDFNRFNFKTSICWTPPHLLLSSPLSRMSAVKDLRVFSSEVSDEFLSNMFDLPRIIFVTSHSHICLIWEKWKTLLKICDCDSVRTLCLIRPIWTVCKCKQNAPAICTSEHAITHYKMRAHFSCKRLICLLADVDLKND